MIRNNNCPFTIKDPLYQHPRINEILRYMILENLHALPALFLECGSANAKLRFAKLIVSRSGWALNYAG